MPGFDINELQRVIKDSNARWKSVTKLDDARKLYHLGYTPGPSEHTLESRELLARSNHMRFMETAELVMMAYPPNFDWRKAAPGNRNFVTMVKDQGGCGSCVSFGCIATVESAVRIKKQKPTLAIDLSEADLFFCHRTVPGGTCATGWYPDAALNSVQKGGVVDEKCYPYTDHDQPCGGCRGSGRKLTKISKWHKITSHADMKNWLARRGPLVTCFSVYNDFFAYRSGIYHHVSGALAGGHCVCCIGYNDSARYWICKNSWGSAWGEKGFFRIQYGQVGIDALMWAVEA